MSATFLSCLNVRTHDEHWCAITEFKIKENNYDHSKHFTKIDESIMLNVCAYSMCCIKETVGDHLTEATTRVLSHLSHTAPSLVIGCYPLTL